ncbi:MAG: DEAD/DEAH box helicase family protein [Sulfurimonas sp.]|nr:DEAD/DEAH box helicase family protein [Sulfurimonas sp.]
MIKLLNEIKKYKDWNDLKLNLIDKTSNTKQKGDIFELITKYYLLIDPIYSTKLNEVWLLSEVPNDVKIYLNLPNNDEGIDLIAKINDDEYWAIQCKYLSAEDTSITREYISTFLDTSNNICKNISQKLVCTTANKRSYKFEKLYDESITFLLSNTWNNLGVIFFSQLNELIKNKTIKLTPFTPKPHQVRAIKNANTHYIDEKNDNGKLIMACGSGKSLTAYWISQQLKSKTILIAVPSLALIKQTLEVWTRESVANNIDINWIAVCSDETVSNINDDVFTASTKDLGIDVSTDINYISNWLQKPKHSSTIVFTTYQSGKIIAEASKNAHITYDLGVMDEAHKTVGLKGSLFSYLLFNENISINKRLFMTATERRYKGESDEIASMDNIELYGEDFEVLTFKEALESKPPILCDYKIIAMMVTKKEVANLIESNKFVRPDNDNYTQEIESEMLASTIALHKAIKKYGIKHTISFHSSIERAKFFQSQEKVFRKSFIDYTDLDTFHVSGTTPIATRNQTLETFSQSENSLITNARCLTEGVDVPNIDCVLFADPRQSTIDIVQAVGRALRLADDKQYGYVLVPILIDDENIDIDDIQNKSFQAIISILRALASNDERIIDYFNTIDGLEVSRGGGVVDFDIPLGLNIDVDEFNNAIKLSIISKIKKLRWRPFEEARAFVRNLKLANGPEWKKYCKNLLKDKPPKPNDIPSSPNSTYKLSGWNGIPDWLGTAKNIEYLPFTEARDFVRNLGIKSGKEWLTYCKLGIEGIDKKPDNIPIYPHQFYRKDGWKNMKDWLRKGNGLKSFREARAFAISLGLKHRSEWQKYCVGKIPNLEKKPEDIPRDPEGRYKKDWINWNDWLTGDTGKVQGEWRPFKEAKEFVRGLNLGGQVEWKKYCKGELTGYEQKPYNIPTSPAMIYKDEGWKDVADWLGTSRRRSNKNSEDDNTWLAYEEARKFAHELKLKGYDEWKMYIHGELDYLPKKPDNIPSSAYFVYKDSGWIGWNDWLGNDNSTKTRVRNALPFEEARNFVRSLGFKKVTEWEDYKNNKLEYLDKIPDSIPKSPNGYYKDDGWIGMNDWLGTADEEGAYSFKKTSYAKNILPYEKARKFSRTLDLKTIAEWKKYSKGLLPSLPDKPSNIPSAPWNVYADKGWTGIRDWLDD